jgi:hypothetical protein
MLKPNCYDCIHRRDLPGDEHSSCNHPSAMVGATPLMQAIAIFSSVGRVPPVANAHAAKKLNVTANPHGIRHGWFNWPFNFDPTWLESCDGFEPKKEP